MERERKRKRAASSSDDDELDGSVSSVESFSDDDISPRAIFYQPATTYERELYRFAERERKRRRADSLRDAVALGGSVSSVESFSDDISPRAIFYPPATTYERVHFRRGAKAQA